MRNVSVFLTISTALLLMACGNEHTEEGPEQRETRSIELGDSQRIRTDLKMAFGELEARSGAQKLLEGDFTYGAAAWKPEVRYSSSGSTGDLLIRQNGRASSGVKGKNRWNLRFNKDVPMDFEIELGAGEARLELGDLNLRGVNVSMGAGTLDLDLRGTPQQDYAVKVRGGVGEATVRLPKNVGISATASGALGDLSVSGLRKDGDRYVNDNFDRASRRIRLDIQGGVGSIKLIAE